MILKGVKKIMQMIKKIFISFCLGILVLIMLSFLLKLNPQTKLAGVFIPNEKPKLEKKAILSGKYQLEYDKWFSDNFPFRSYIVKAYDQILYSFKSEFNGIQKGKNKDLHGTMWIDGYLINEYDKTVVDEYLNNIDFINQYLKSKNKRLIYIISPNKAEVHKKTLPFKYKLIDKVVKNKSGLRKYIVNFLDKTEIFNFDTTSLMETKEKENERMFPKGGIHWNQLGASYTLVDLFEKMNNSGIRIPKVSIKNVTYSNVPTSDEADYKDLLNVYKSFNDSPYPVAELEYTGIDERKYNVFGMTTSYTNMIVEQFFRYGMPFQRFKRLYYNQLHSELYYNNGVISGERWLPGIQMDQVNYQEILDSYDILIIEHNAGELPQAHMEFVKNFANYLKNIKN